MKGLMQMKKSLCALMCAIVGFAGAEPLTLTWNVISSTQCWISPMPYRSPS